MIHGEGPSNNTPKEGGHGKGHFRGRTPHHATGLPLGFPQNIGPATDSDGDTPGVSDPQDPPGSPAGY